MTYEWLNIIVAATAGVATGLLLINMFHTRRLLFSFITAVITLLAFVIAVFFITPYYKIISFDRQLKSTPVFKALAAQDPETFKAFILTARPLILKQQSPSQLSLAAEQMTQRAFIKTLKKATDQAITAYLTATIQLYDKLLTVNPQLVLAYEFSSKFTTINFYTLDTSPFQQELEQLDKAKAAIISSAVRDPQPEPASAEIISLADKIAACLSKTYGANAVKLTFTQPASAALDAGTGARIIIAYYQQVLALGPVNAGKFIRLANKL